MKNHHHLILPLLIAVQYTFSQSGAYVAGNSYWDENRYVEYAAGNLPIVISVPHDGSVKPETIPDRSFGVTFRDLGTQEIVRTMMEEFKRQTGKYPHVVLSHLSRTKLDPNREEFEAAQEDPAALKAWNEYHDFIDSAIAAAKKVYKYMFVIDLHGQNNPEERIEIGYRLENDDLMASDSSLNTTTSIEKSSLKNLLKFSSLQHSELVRGESSVGALFDANAVRSTPSPSQPGPGSYKFFSGGYTIFRHVVEDTSTVFGVQFELNEGLRSPDRRKSTAIMLVNVVMKYLRTQCGKNVENWMK